jgi:hypothetical protein
MSTVKDIINLIDEAGLESVVFVHYKTQPTIQKDGIQYRILSITPGETGIELDCIPNYGWCLKHLDVDESWNRKTIDKIARLVDEYTFEFR